MEVMVELSGGRRRPGGPSVRVQRQRQRCSIGAVRVSSIGAVRVSSIGAVRVSGTRTGADG